MELEFTSFNPYQKLKAITADSPDELVKEITAIRTPIKILQIYAQGSKHIAIIQGDIKTKTKKKGA